TAASRLAGAVAGAAEDAGKHVRFPVDHIGVVVTPGGDQPDIFRNGSMGETRPLTIDNLVKVGGIRNVGLLQRSSVSDASDHMLFDRLAAVSAPRDSGPARHRQSGAILRHRRCPEKPFAFNY